jgi:hypothetical protein
MTSRKTAPIFFCAFACFALAMGLAAAAPPAGSPIISYNSPFIIWSDAHLSFCQLDATSSYNYVKCSTGLTDAAAATRFAITGGSGQVPSSVTLDSTLSVYNAANQVCRVETGDYKLLIKCDQASGGTNYFRFANVIQQSDGKLHGNSTSIKFSNTACSTSGICSAKPATTFGGATACNKNYVGSWETFYFVPVSA